MGSLQRGAMHLVMDCWRRKWTWVIIESIKRWACHISLEIYSLARWRCWHSNKWRAQTATRSAHNLRCEQRTLRCAMFITSALLATWRKPLTRWQQKQHDSHIGVWMNEPGQVEGKTETSWTSQPGGRGGGLTWWSIAAFTLRGPNPNSASTLAARA